MLPTILLPHLHVLVTSACFCAREISRPLLLATPYSISQPFSRRRINERHVYVISVLAAKLLKGSVGNKRIANLESAFANESLDLFSRNSQQFGGAFPGVRVMIR